VNDAGNRAVGEMICEREARRRQTEDPENENGGRESRRHEDQFPEMQNAKC
jgi:hypothetical protein